MARIIRVAVANITTHPHSPENYITIFTEVLKLCRSAKVRGSDHLILGKFSPISEGNPLGGIWGQFYRYVNIDKSMPALDLDKLEPIFSKDGSATIPIPDNIKPNLRMVDFVFFPHGHRLFFSLEHISPYTALSAFVALFNALQIFEKHGDVNVILEQKSDIMTEISKLESLTRLTLKFTIPNGDDLSHLKNSLTTRYGKRLNATQVTESYTGSRKRSLTPKNDDETMASIELALSNGEVTAEGFQEGTKVALKSKRYPEVFTQRYNPNQMTKVYTLQSMARSLMDKFTRKG